MTRFRPFHSLGAEPAQGPSEATGDGASLQPAEQTPPSALAQEEAAQLLPAAKWVSPAAGSTAAPAQGAQSAVRIGGVPEARFVQQPVHAEHLAGGAPRPVARYLGGSRQGCLHRQARDAPNGSDAARWLFYGKRFRQS